MAHLVNILALLAWLWVAYRDHITCLCVFITTIGYPEALRVNAREAIQTRIITGIAGLTFENELSCRLEENGKCRCVHDTFRIINYFLLRRYYLRSTCRFTQTARSIRLTVRNPTCPHYHLAAIPSHDSDHSQRIVFRAIRKVPTPNPAIRCPGTSDTSWP